jgi:hypothetical protein
VEYILSSRNLLLDAIHDAFDEVPPPSLEQAINETKAILANRRITVDSDALENAVAKRWAEYLDQRFLNVVPLKGFQIMDPMSSVQELKPEKASITDGYSDPGSIWKLASSTRTQSHAQEEIVVSEKTIAKPRFNVGDHVISRGKRGTIIWQRETLHPTLGASYIIAYDHRVPAYYSGQKRSTFETNNISHPHPENAKIIEAIDRFPHQSSDTRYLYDTDQSLSPLKPVSPDVSAGTRVFHSTYGFGTVQFRAHDTNLVIAFDKPYGLFSAAVFSDKNFAGFSRKTTPEEYCTIYGLDPRDMRFLSISAPFLTPADKPIPFTKITPAPKLSDQEIADEMPKMEKITDGMPLYPNSINDIIRSVENLDKRLSKVEAVNSKLEKEIRTKKTPSTSDLGDLAISIDREIIRELNDTIKTLEKEIGTKQKRELIQKTGDMDTPNKYPKAPRPSSSVEQLLAEFTQALNQGPTRTMPSINSHNSIDLPLEQEVKSTSHYLTEPKAFVDYLDKLKVFDYEGSGGCYPDRHLTLQYCQEWSTLKLQTISNLLSTYEKRPNINSKFSEAAMSIIRSTIDRANDDVVGQKKIEYHKAHGHYQSVDKLVRKFQELHIIDNSLETYKNQYEKCAAKWGRWTHIATMQEILDLPQAWRYCQAPFKTIILNAIEKINTIGYGASIDTLGLELAALEKELEQQDVPLTTAAQTETPKASIPNEGYGSLFGSAVGGIAGMAYSPMSAASIATGMVAPPNVAAIASGMVGPPKTATAKLPSPTDIEKENYFNGIPIYVLPWLLNSTNRFGRTEQLARDLQIYGIIPPGDIEWAKQVVRIQKWSDGDIWEMENDVACVKSKKISIDTLTKSFLTITSYYSDAKLPPTTSTQQELPMTTSTISQSFSRQDRIEKLVSNFIANDLLGEAGKAIQIDKCQTWWEADLAVMESMLWDLKDGRKTKDQCLTQIATYNLIGHNPYSDNTFILSDLPYYPLTQPNSISFSLPPDHNSSKILLDEKGVHLNGKEVFVNGISLDHILKEIKKSLEQTEENNEVGQIKEDKKWDLLWNEACAIEYAVKSGAMKPENFDNWDLNPEAVKIWHQEFQKPTSPIIHELTQAGYRIGATQAANALKAVLVKAVPQDNLPTVHSFLDSELGFGMVSLMSGWGLTYAMPENEKAQKIAGELRINGLTTFGNAACEELLETIVGAIQTAVKDIPEEVAAEEVAAEEGPELEIISEEDIVEEEFLTKEMGQ